MAKKAGSPDAPPILNPPATHNEPTPLTAGELDDLFLVHLATARADNDTLEKAMEVIRGIKKTRTRNRNLARTDGFPLVELDSILADELLPRHEVEDREAKRLRMRGVANQPGGSLEQGDLFNDSFAQAEKDEAYWRGHGLTVGLRGLEADPVKFEVPQEHHQTWMAERMEGQKRLAAAWETKKRLEGATVQ